MEINGRERAHVRSIYRRRDKGVTDRNIALTTGAPHPPVRDTGYSVQVMQIDPSDEPVE